MFATTANHVCKAVTHLQGQDSCVYGVFKFQILVVSGIKMTAAVCVTFLTIFSAPTQN